MFVVGTKYVGIYDLLVGRSAASYYGVITLEDFGHNGVAKREGRFEAFGQALPRTDDALYAVAMPFERCVDS